MTYKNTATIKQPSDKEFLLELFNTRNIGYTFEPTIDVDGTRYVLTLEDGDDGVEANIEMSCGFKFDAVGNLIKVFIDG